MNVMQLSEPDYARYMVMLNTVGPDPVLRAAKSEFWDYVYTKYGISEKLFFSIRGDGVIVVNRNKVRNPAALKNT